MNKLAELPTLFTTNEVADYLNVSPLSIKRARQTGLLPFMKVRGGIRYTETNIITYLERCQKNRNFNSTATGSRSEPEATITAQLGTTPFPRRSPRHCPCRLSNCRGKSRESRRVAHHVGGLRGALR